MKLTKPRRYGATTGAVFEAIGKAIRSHDRQPIKVCVDKNSNESGWSQIKRMSKIANDIIKSNNLRMKVDSISDRHITLTSTYPVTYEDETGNVFSVIKED